MKVYEMVFHKGTYETSRFFYSHNNKASRQHFIECLRLEIEMELNDFKLSCTDNNKHDLMELFKEIHKESNSHLDAMADQFIEN